MSTHSLHLRLLMLAALLACSPFFSFGQASSILKEGFKNPPPSAWPRTWWHWTKSNVTKEGITKDLEWMKRVGIAGFQLADVAAGSGQEVESKIVFGSKEWLDAVRHTAAEAERLDLEMAIFSSAGWSLTGGPWVKPEEAMKKLVWSETSVDGGRTIQMKLPQPPSTTGPGQAVQHLMFKMASTATSQSSPFTRRKMKWGQNMPGRSLQAVDRLLAPTDCSTMISAPYSTSSQHDPTKKRGSS